MGMPQGWYDDGTGQLRWWDGARWGESSGPAAGGTAFPVPPASSASGAFGAAPSPASGGFGVGDPFAVPTTLPPIAGGDHSSPPSVRRKPVLGVVGLILAALGTALAVIPTALDAHGFVMVSGFVIGGLLLLAAFVVSLVGTFRRNTRRWPSASGIGLSVVGGVAATVMFATAMLAPAPDVPLPVTAGTPTPDAEPAEPSVERPTAEEIAAVFQEKVQPAENQWYHEYIYECMGEDLYGSDLSNDEVQQVLDTDAATLRELLETHPRCSEEISTIVDGDIHGEGREISIGAGMTVKITVRPGQLREAEGILPGQAATEDDYGYSWGNAVETGGQIAVMTITVRNNGDATQSENAAFCNLVDPSVEFVPSNSGMFAALDYPSDPFSITHIAPGEEKTFVEVYSVTADQIGQVSAKIIMLKNMGEGNGFIIR